MTTRLAESPGRPLERHGNVSPREMTVHGAQSLSKGPRTEPGVQAGPFAPATWCACGRVDPRVAPVNRRSRSNTGGRVACPAHARAPVRVRRQPTRGVSADRWHRVHSLRSQAGELAARWRPPSSRLHVGFRSVHAEPSLATTDLHPLVADLSFALATLSASEPGRGSPPDRGMNDPAVRRHTFSSPYACRKSAPRRRPVRRSGARRCRDRERTDVGHSHGPR